MPIGVGAASLIGAGITAAASTGQVVASGKMNKKSRFHALRMYERQSADELKNWHLQNEYNSPAAQMSRLKEAGLNPNLVYGNGATTTSDSIHTGQMSNPQQYAPDIAGIGRSAMDGIANYYDLRMKNAQISNAEKQGSLLDKDLQLKGQEITRNNWELWNDQQLAPGSLEAQGLKIREMSQGITLRDKQEVRNAAKHTSDMKAAAEQLLRNYAQRTKMDPLQRALVRAQISNLKDDHQLKQYEIELNKQGIQKNDPLYARKLNEWWQQNKPLNGELKTDYKGRTAGQRFSENLGNWYPPVMLYNKFNRDLDSLGSDWKKAWSRK